MNSAQAPKAKTGSGSIILIDWKVILRKKVLLCLAGGLLLVGALWALRWYLYHPPRPWIVRWQVSRYLRKNSLPAVFTVSSFPFPSKAEMAAPPKAPDKPAVAKGSRTGKDFDTLAQEYIELKTSILLLEYEKQLAQQLAQIKAGNGTNSALESDLRVLRQRVALREKNSNVGAGLEPKEAALAPILADLLDFQKAWDEELVATGAVGANKLAAACAQFTAEMRNKLDEASSYPSMYQVIGQQLWVADRLLDSRNPEHRRRGLTLALDASRNAVDEAENGWLGARICEGYVLPNFDLTTEADRRSPFYLQNLVDECVNIFRHNDESASIIRVYEMLLAKAKAQPQADSARAQISREYERAGDYKQAIYYLRQIKATNDYRWAVRRIPFLQQQLKNK